MYGSTEIIETAVASPNDLPIPNITPVRIPVLAALSVILNEVWFLVAPNARDECSSFLSTILIEVAVIRVIVGIIINDKVTTIVAKEPDNVPNNVIDIISKIFAPKAP